MELKRVWLYEETGSTSNGIDKTPTYLVSRALANVNSMGMEKQQLIFGKIYREIKIVRIIGKYNAEKIQFEKNGKKYDVTMKKQHDNNSIFYVVTDRGVVHG